MTAAVLTRVDKLDDLALYRISNILKRRVLASFEQLLVKCVECGRPPLSPMQLRDSLSNLIHIGILSCEIGPGEELFFYLSTTPVEKLQERREKLYPIMESWEHYGRDRSQLMYMIQEELAEDVDSEQHGDLLILQKGYQRVSMLVLNEHEWLSHSDHRIWQLIRICEEEELRPAVIARKVEPFCLSLLRRAGLPIVQAHYQYFSPIIEAKLERVKHRDYGGYKDLAFAVQLPDNISRFVNKGCWSHSSRLNLEQLGQLATRVLRGDQAALLDLYTRAA